MNVGKLRVADECPEAAGAGSAGVATNLSPSCWSCKIAVRACDEWESAVCRAVACGLAGVTIIVESTGTERLDECPLTADENV